MSKPPLFFIVIIALIVAAASFRYVQQRREKTENDAAPVTQEDVVVASKREKPATGRLSREQQVAPPAQTVRYEATFRPQEGGAEMRFRMDEAHYHQLTVGDQGRLVYQGSRFLEFVPAPAR
ncbi:DUF2500 domain-containing protein [Cronobacter muytjensii]|uniref:DUF2500 domain-containing protein n=1 Tax=Cronobacter TaxID=413496 RepID=UPI000283FDB3|nr:MULTISPECIES: DUF2500 domain-containing protein [Cronobacter]ELY2496799.1 DUF2500 domain-containing protein [Cronobacter muytjensii]ELY3983421.1 DUF2500 domain-containing protein [Cronobacter muytjensii]ELY4671293.1 DUF2500 domain-containing protein [Cronobacter muytjensii]MDI6455861.1 DUF2500 domain-containing protein [Cronobacter muytjensii]NCI17947.1 DUF2500 domain-containing protein [Cronobacter muytjensii]